MNPLSQAPELGPLLQPPDTGRGDGEGEAPARLKIGDLARLTGRSVRALRLYEELRLLHPDERTHGGFRVYGKAAVLRVRWIGKLQDLGFTLNAIQDLVGMANPAASGSDAVRRVRACFEEKLLEVRQQAEKLRALEQELVCSLEYLATCQSCPRAPAAAVCRECAEPGHDAAHTPGLVDGIRAGM